MPCRVIEGLQTDFSSVISNRVKHGRLKKCISIHILWIMITIALNNHRKIISD